ncbi:G-protein coupled receptor 4-like [Enoplosus armatus]|uniref:G-protein coupled receptor 4-like n=1 Tax=Enoplosus armatus TaxID=215367 RepID=UPI003996BBB1
MEDSYNNFTSQGQSYNYSNMTHDYDYGSLLEYYTKVLFIVYVMKCIFICIGLPLTLTAICALYSMVQNDHVAPIYVINLFLSDIIQLCHMIFEVAAPQEWQYGIFVHIYMCGLMSSVGFMLCVALERYLLIAHPLWYRFRRSIKMSVVVCVVVWAIPPFFQIASLLEVDSMALSIMLILLFLLPLPLFIFFLCGTIRALSASISVPSDEKRRIVGILVLVLLIYTVLFLPFAIMFLIEEYNFALNILSVIFIKFSPLADLLLYVFLRKGAVDKLLASVCCCRTDSDDINTPTV